jgi:hypothetical protein
VHWIIQVTAFTMGIYSQKFLVYRAEDEGLLFSEMLVALLLHRDISDPDSSVV